MTAQAPEKNSYSTEDLVALVSEKLQCTKKDGSTIVGAVVDAVTELLAARPSLRVHNLGTLNVSERAARVGRNPKTGEAIDVAATTVINLRASQKLKDAVKAGHAAK